MTDLDDRLRDAFGALDDNISMPPRRDVLVRRLPSTRVLLAAAAVLAVIASVTVASLVRSSSDDVGVFAQAITPAEFNDRVDALCMPLRFNRVQPRFATIDAYRIAADERSRQVAKLRKDLLAVPAPTDDARLRDEVVANLGLAAERLRYVQDLVDLGRLDALPSSWPAVDDYYDLALQQLHEHGATECTR
jgi:hypothetical protein